MKIDNSSISAREVTATSDATNAGSIATPNVMTDMAFTTPASGTYLVTFSTTVDHSQQVVSIAISLFVGGTKRADTTRDVVPRFNGLGAQSLSPMVSINAVVIVDGSQDIDIRWGTASGTATAHQRTFSLLKIA